ncbi:glycosyltransferase [Nocardia goodfellowii]
MRVLMIGPTGGGGSLPPYLNVLSAGLEQHGVRVDRLGTSGVPYDPAASAFWTADRIVDAAEQLLATVDLRTYDLLSIHYGNLEIEQLLPMLWQHSPRPPVVYHVHSLDWTLFADQVPNPVLRQAVEDAVDRMDGFVFFGEYGRTQLIRRHNLDVPSTVAWLPSTIPAGTLADPGPLRTVLRPRLGPLASLYGYAAPWKDAGWLIRSCTRTTRSSRMILAGPFWDHPTETGIDLTREVRTGRQHGSVHIDVVADYLRPCHRKALVEATDFAVFPYRHTPTFQGSGAIADYLAHGVPVLVTEVANMSELVGDAGHVVAANDYDAFAAGIDRLAADREFRDTLQNNAARHAERFATSHHAANCLRLYEAVIAHTHPRRHERSRNARY